MAVFRVDVLVDDPYPVFDWINEHVPRGLVVRLSLIFDRNYAEGVR